MGIRIPESGKFFLVESGMQQIFGVESGMQLKESGIQVPLTNNPESIAGIQKPRLPWIPFSGAIQQPAQQVWGRKEKIRGRAREGRKRRGHLLSPSRVPLAQPFKKINRCLLLRLQYRGSRVFNSLRATDNSHTLSEVHKARFGSYEAQKNYTLQQEWEKNSRIFPSVPYR